MDLDTNKAVVRQWLTGWNERGVDAVDDLFTPHITDQQLAPGAGGAVSVEAFKERLRTVDAMLGPGRFDEQDMIAEGDRVLVRWTLQGTHRGPYLGLSPTGRPFRVDGVNIFRVVDGRIDERWSFLDVPALIAQLGGRVVAAEQG